MDSKKKRKGGAPRVTMKFFLALKNSPEKKKNDKNDVLFKSIMDFVLIMNIYETYILR